MKDLFYYQREVKKKVPSTEMDANGNPIMKEEVSIMWDCFNLNCVVRGYWASAEVFVVALNDGHEQADDVQKPVVKNGKIVGVDIKRERGWYMSQIELNKEDGERLKKWCQVYTHHENGKLSEKLSENY